MTAKKVKVVDDELMITENVEEKPKAVSDKQRKANLIAAGGCSRIKVEKGKWIDVYTGEIIPEDIGIQMVE